MKIARLSHRLLVVPLLGFYTALSLAATDPDNVKLLDRAGLDALLAQPERLVLIDLRRPDELTDIGGFGVYLSIQNDELAQRLD